MASVRIDRLAGLELDGCRLLDALAEPLEAGQDRVTLFFSTGTDPERAAALIEAPILGTALQAGAPVLQCAVPRGRSVTLLGARGRAGVSPARPLPGPFAGRDVLLGTRNGEPPEIVARWLRFHHGQDRVTGAVLVDQAPPQEAAAFAEALRALLDAQPDDIEVLVLASDLPLGKPDLPAEAHPACVAEAPGKDRMTIPPADPRRAPLGETAVYEIARRRALTRAAGIANLDPQDLLMRAEGAPSPFDAARAAAGGMVWLQGQHCYPWRVRAGAAPDFGDHICVQFDRPRHRRRWCVAPACLSAEAQLRMTRVTAVAAELTLPFHRCMAIRRPDVATSRIVPKSSLVESEALIARAEAAFGATPVRMPKASAVPSGARSDRVAIVTTMKDEGPFILDWVAYHRAIGIDDILVYTNDCSDGTVELLDLLQDNGAVQRRDNPFRATGLKPQHAALQAAEDEPAIRDAGWVVCMDVDEYINVRCGAGRLEDLFAAVGEANMISMTWRLFGNADAHGYEDVPVIVRFDRCAEEFTPKPHQAWGFKTLFRNAGLFKKLGVHRPKGLRPQLLDQIRWVNGSGRPMPRHDFRTAWRSTTETVGYDLVALNHYAVRSAESFLVKRDRGRVNHVDRDQGLAYWFRMNNNATRDLSIRRMLPAMSAERARLETDPRIAAAHAACVAAHRARIARLRADPAFAAFYDEITGGRMQRLSRLHRHFGANVFLRGPEAVPDNVVWNDHAPDFHFTIRRGATRH